MNQTILIADDEKEILSLLRLYLENSGYRVLEACDGASALSLIRTEDISLALIDIMMPKMDGYTLIREIRRTRNLPVIILSAKSELSDKILGLGLGADDYITKPFDALEVTARVDAQLRRFCSLGSQKPAVPETITVHDLTLDTSSCTLIKNGTAVDLTSTEYKILKLFMESPGRVFTRKQIYEAAWGDEYVMDDNNIMVYISRIREKTGQWNGSSYIHTIRGLGYKMIP